MSVALMTEAFESVKKLTPESLKNYEDFIASLEWCIDDISYRAPEEQWVSWNHFESRLIKFLGTPDTDWKKEINKELYRITKQAVKK